MSDLAKQSVRQFTEAWRVLCSPSPTYRQSSEPGVSYELSGVPIAFFNVAVLTGEAVDAANLAALAARAREHVEGTPWILLTTDELLATPADAAATLDASGFTPVMPLTGMLADDVAGGPAPAGLDLQVPSDDASCASLLDVNSAAYGMSFDAGKAVWGSARFWQDHVAVLGVTAGEPVATSAVMKVDGHRYVALVATAPAQQRKGYADAAMRRALELAAQAYGPLPTFLHATEAGRPVYERMGYKAVAHHTVYMDKSLLGGH